MALRQGAAQRFNTTPSAVTPAQVQQFRQETLDPQHAESMLQRAAQLLGKRPEELTPQDMEQYQRSYSRAGVMGMPAAILGGRVGQQLATPRLPAGMSPLPGWRGRLQANRGAAGNLAGQAVFGSLANAALQKYYTGEVDAGSILQGAAQVPSMTAMQQFTQQMPRLIGSKPMGGGAGFMVANVLSDLADRAGLLPTELGGQGVGNRLDWRQKDNQYRMQGQAADEAWRQGGLGYVMSPLTKGLMILDAVSRPITTVETILGGGTNLERNIRTGFGVFDNGLWKGRSQEGTSINEEAQQRVSAAQRREQEMAQRLMSGTTRGLTPEMQDAYNQQLDQHNRELAAWRQGGGQGPMPVAPAAPGAEDGWLAHQARFAPRWMTARELRQGLDDYGAATADRLGEEAISQLGPGSYLANGDLRADHMVAYRDAERQLRQLRNQLVTGTDAQDRPLDEATKARLQQQYQQQLEDVQVRRRYALGKPDVAEPRLDQDLHRQIIFRREMERRQKQEAAGQNPDLAVENFLEPGTTGASRFILPIQGRDGQIVPLPAGTTREEARERIPQYERAFQALPEEWRQRGWAGIADYYREHARMPPQLELQMVEQRALPKRQQLATLQREYEQLPTGDPRRNEFAQRLMGLQQEVDAYARLQEHHQRQIQEDLQEATTNARIQERHQRRRLGELMTGLGS